MRQSSPPADRTLTIKKTLKAPVSLVWEAWTNPEHIAGWWGPAGMNTKVNTHDFQVGGAWNYAMTMPDGNEFTAEGVYSLIDEMSRIFTSANFRPMTEGVEMQSHFEAKGEETEFTFHVIHDTAEYCQQQEQMGFYNGWGSVFDRLEAHLTASA